MQAPSLSANRTPTSLRGDPQNEQQSVSFVVVFFPIGFVMRGVSGPGPKGPLCFQKRMFGHFFLRPASTSSIRPYSLASGAVIQ